MKANVKKTVTKKQVKVPSPVKKTAPVKVVKRRELTPIEKSILWSLSLGAKGVGDVQSELNLDQEMAENSMNKLLNDGFITRTGTIMRRYEMTSQGKNTLGVSKIKIDAYTNINKMKSGDHATLTIVSTNIGTVPVRNALVRITSPRFINVSRHGSEYSEDLDSFKVEFPLTQLNPKESQMKVFDLHGNLTQGTVTSRYKLLVEALTSEKVKDKKELSITVEK